MAHRESAVRPGGGGAQRWAGWADAGVPARGALWAEPRFVSLTLGVAIVVVLTNTTVDRMSRRGHPLGVRSRG
jgi:hypothetical protein